jgi:transcriptional regulator with AAA-type ATPase domain
MTFLSPASLRAFDGAARDEVHGLIRSNQGSAALDRLASYEPCDRLQRIEFHGLRALAKNELGDRGGAIQDWLRALHLTSRWKESRARVRNCLADTLRGMGDLARAERVVQRCVAEIRADGGSASAEASALSTLARIHHQRGTLTLAVRLYERAIHLGVDRDSNPVSWAGIRSNYALTLIRLGEFRHAEEILSEVEASGRGLHLFNLAPVLLNRVHLRLESEDFDGGERALASVDDRIVGDNPRYRLCWLQHVAALEIARGRPVGALEALEQARHLAQTRFPMDKDLVSESSRLKAVALLDSGRPYEALESAQEAIRACGGTDMLDRPAGLRVAGRCLAALGRREEAKNSLAAALSLLESTEFVVERRKLYKEMESLGVMLPGVHAAIAPPDPGASPSGECIHRFRLRDGRFFHTSDRELVERIRVAAQSRLPVLLEGETGTGKELVARLLHELGSASEGPFVVVDCTTLTEALAEGELFGTARGAYTGAVSDRLGLVGAADGGTLLFDELPELSLHAQSKLLRLLQEGTYRRLGEAQPRRVQVRVIATTNQDSDRLLAQGTLKADLFFRLHGYRIRLRPLRDRHQDMMLLAQEFARAEGLLGVAPEALAELRSCSWPGNARQLEMLIRVAASSLGAGRSLERDLVAGLLREGPHLPAVSAERQRLQAALNAHAGNVAATARALNISRQGLYKALRRNGLI